jgi:hypothetical protein
MKLRLLASHQNPRAALVSGLVLTAAMAVATSAMAQSLLAAPGDCAEPRAEQVVTAPVQALPAAVSGGASGHFQPTDAADDGGAIRVVTDLTQVLTQRQTRLQASTTTGLLAATEPLLRQGTSTLGEATGTVGEILETTLESAAPVVELTEPVLELTEPVLEQTHPILEPTLELTDPILEPTLELTDPILDPASSLLGGAL